MLVTEARYKLNLKDVLHAVCKEKPFETQELQKQNDRK
jgi:hypothetical protein